MAKTEGKAPVVIPQEVQDDIIGIALLNRKLEQIRESIAFKQQRIVARLAGDDGLVADLIAEHNRRAAKIRRQAGVR